MRMLDALDLASKSSGTATGAEFPRSTAANGSPLADRSISRNKDSRRRNRATEFEERLMALAGACTVSSPAAAAADAPNNSQQSVPNEAVTATLPSKPDGNPSINSGSLEPPEHGAEFPTLPQMPAPAVAVGSETAVPPVSDAPPAVTTACEPSGLTLPDPTSQAALPAVPAGASQDLVSASAVQTPLPLKANSDATGLPVQAVLSSGDSQTSGRSSPIAPHADREGAISDEGSPARPAGENRSVEPKGMEAHDDLWRFEAAANANGRQETISDAQSGERNLDSRESEHDSQSGSIDSLLAAHPVIDQTTGTTTQSSTRSESVPDASVTEQVFGEIATRVELTRREGRIDFRLRLDPPGMGTVHVHLTATDHSVTAQVVADDPAAHQAIESQLHTLRESLADLGVSLEHSGGAHDNGGSRGAWQWQQPAPPATTSTTSIQSSANRPNVLHSRQKTGVIDVVV